tara:strand:- start:62 stop:286 length:225 start_codon:yes stop_codon:yes gene_type:complete
MEEEEDYFIIDLGDEASFVNQFYEPHQVFDFLLELFEEYAIVEIEAIKQAFLNQNKQAYYMECFKFESIYLLKE